MKPRSKNTVTKRYEGDKIIPHDSDRSYFFIVMISGAGSIEFGRGGGEIPLVASEHYSPYVCPTGEISIKSTGAYVVHMG